MKLNRLFFLPSKTYAVTGSPLPVRSGVLGVVEHSCKRRRAQDSRQQTYIALSIGNIAGEGRESGDSVMGTQVGRPVFCLPAKESWAIGTTLSLWKCEDRL